MLVDNKIRAFLTIVQLGSFTAAARKLGLTQPAVSAQIGALESALGVPLFERGRELSLTPQGERFLGYAQRIQEAYDWANEAFVNVFAK